MISLNATQEPTGKLDPEAWLTDPTTVSVLDALEAGGTEVRFVGGCVRDALAKKPVHDIDLGTPDKPEQVVALLKAADIRAVPTGLQHGTVTAVTKGKSFEITTLRRDVETDGRRAVIAYTDDWIVDSSRRDFTINAMSANRAGDVYDYHEGIPDLAHGRIRFIGRADDRIQEDYLRILRYFRFFALFGRPPYDDAAFSACRKHAQGLENISAERIQYELMRTLGATEPAEAFIMMRDAHVLEVVLPEATQIGSLRSAAWLESRGLVMDGLAPSPLRRLGALLGTNTDAKAVAKRLRLSNLDTARLAALLKLLPAMKLPTDAVATRRMMHKLGAEAVVDAAVVSWACRLADIGKLPHDESQARREQLEVALSWETPSLPIDGSDAKKAGIPHGPDIGHALRTVEDWWANNDFEPDREGCLKRLIEVATEMNKKGPAST